MVSSDESSPPIYTSADFFLAELTSQYSVSEKFLKGFISRVEKIFEHEIKDDQRESLLKLARVSIQRQAETEELIREASSALDRLTIPPKRGAGQSRRHRPVSASSTPDEISPELHISSAS